MKKNLLILRKKSKHFNSIENVFNSLLPYLEVDLLVLPNESKGMINRLRNIVFLGSKLKNQTHISGHDHYLLWWPFKKAILTIHDIEALKRKSGIRRWLFQKLWFDIPIGNASIVTTISEFSKMEILTLKSYKKPIQVIHNPLTLDLNYSPKVFNEQCPRILHLGTKKNKNLRRLIAALKGVSCELVIIGQNDQEILDYLEISGLKYEFKNGLTNQEVIQEYVECDMLSFISTYEGFGLPIIEAQACGRVVITSKLASMPEIAGEGAYFVDPFDVHNMAEGIKEIISNNTLREELIERGLGNVKKFQPQEIAAHYRSLYDSLD